MLLARALSVHLTVHRLLGTHTYTRSPPEAFLLTASPRKKRPPSGQALQNEVGKLAIPTCRRPSSPRGICIRICYPGPPRLFRALDDEREWKYGGSLMFGWAPFRSTCAGISRPPPPLALLALRGSHSTSMLLCTTTQRLSRMTAARARVQGAAACSRVRVDVGPNGTQKNGNPLPPTRESVFVQRWSDYSGHSTC